MNLRFSSCFSWNLSYPSQLSLYKWTLWKLKNALTISGGHWGERCSGCISLRRCAGTCEHGSWTPALSAFSWSIRPRTVFSSETGDPRIWGRCDSPGDIPWSNPSIPGEGEWPWMTLFSSWGWSSSLFRSWGRSLSVLPARPHRFVLRCVEASRAIENIVCGWKNAYYDF